MAVPDDVMARAVRAGWNPADGDPPFDHGEFVEGLASSDRLEDLLDTEGGAQ
jgi:hypothetical protein